MGSPALPAQPPPHDGQQSNLLRRSALLPAPAEPSPARYQSESHRRNHGPVREDRPRNRAPATGDRSRPRPSPRPPRRGSDPGPLPEGTTLVLALSTSTSPPASPTTLRRCDPPAAHRRAHSPADRCARKRQVRSPIRPVQLSRESRELQPAPQGTRVIGARVRPGGHLRPNASATTPRTKSRGEAIAATPEREQRWCRGDRASRRAAAGVQLVQDLPQDRAVGAGAAGGPVNTR